jgi:hypothetical protein
VTVAAAFQESCDDRDVVLPGKGGEGSDERAVDGLGVRGEVRPHSARITHLEPSVSTRTEDNTKRARILSGTRVAVTLTDYVPFAEIEGVARGAVGGGPVIR